jgi:leucyl aminopeptidase (aminopeptidase T)
MPDTRAMIEAARRAMIHVLKLSPSDRVLVVTDAATQAAGEAFRAAAAGEGCATTLWPLPEQERPLSAVPAELAEMVAGVTVVINAVQGRNDEIPFRVAWLRLVSAAGTIRCGHSPGITTAMMEAGPLNVDYAAMTALGGRLIDALAGAETVRLTSPLGTDLVLGITGRRFHHDCLATPATPCNLPCGEIYCAPEETRGDGILVVDGSIGAVGTVASPVRIELRGGRIADIACNDERLLAEVRRLTSLDDQAAVVGELGIGINSGARIVGRMLEDEKAFRTAHVAFGNNEDFGGRNGSSTHLDFLFHRPSVVARWADGSRRDLLQDGDIRA